ncbi:MAG TPA: hypothetical protein VHD62_15385 [Opitutaceae bacterium]|nr:hypothetical protein [Opitutaceae bacterium]
MKVHVPHSSSRSLRGASFRLSLIVSLFGSALLLLSSGCTTASGERPGFWGSVRQGIDMAAMGVGLAGQAKGVPGGEDLGRQGAEDLDKAVGNTK